MEFEIVQCEFKEVLPVWESLLWPGREDIIKSKSSMLFLGGCDMDIYNNKDYFWAAILKETKEIIGVNSGFPTSNKQFRSRGLYVLKNWRKKGVGKKLIEESIKKAKELNLFEIWSFPRKESFKLYESAGFEKASEWIDEKVEFGPNCYASLKLNAQKYEEENCGQLEHVLTGLEALYESYFIEHLRKSLRKYPKADWRDSLSRGQILSKKWLIETLHKTYSRNFDVGYILGGWNGVLPALILENKNPQIKKIRSFDSDPKCVEIAESLNRHWVTKDWTFKASLKDMYDLNYEQARYETLKSNGEKECLEERPDIIINTCCEHLLEFSKWRDLIPKGKTVILQSNDFYRGKDHVNCVSSIEEFIEKAKLSRIDFSGVLELDLYKRFMLIGEA